MQRAVGEEHREFEGDRESNLKLRKQIWFWTELLSSDRQKRGCLRDVA
jgi:hypothetical protein